MRADQDGVADAQRVVGPRSALSTVPCSTRE